MQYLNGSTESSIKPQQKPQRVRGRRWAVASGTCPHCGVTFQRRVIRNGEKREFCSKSCSVKHRWKSGGMAMSVERRRIVALRNSRARDLFVAAKLMERNLRTYAPMFGKCMRCGVMYWRQLDRQRFCDDRCRMESKIDAKRKARKTVSSRVSKIAYKARRRSRQFVASENVDPIVVMDRDGWTCMDCGIETPRSLRGSIEPNAPELDHIKPLALGGSHTYANVQCLCRKCNAAKGASMPARDGGAILSSTMLSGTRTPRAIFALPK